MPSHAEAEEVEERDRYRDGDAGPQYRGGVDHLVPAAREVKERRDVGVVCEQRHGEDDADGTEEALPADCNERRNRIMRHNLLCLVHATTQKEGARRGRSISQQRTRIYGTKRAGGAAHTFNDELRRSAVQRHERAH